MLVVDRLGRELDHRGRSADRHEPRKESLERERNTGLGRRAVEPVGHKRVYLMVGHGGGGLGDSQSPASVLPLEEDADDDDVLRGGADDVGAGEPEPDDALEDELELVGAGDESSPHAVSDVPASTSVAKSDGPFIT